MKPTNEALLEPLSVSKVKPPRVRARVSESDHTKASSILGIQCYENIYIAPFFDFQEHGLDLWKTHTLAVQTIWFQSFLMAPHKLPAPH